VVTIQAIRRIRAVTAKTLQWIIRNAHSPQKIARQRRKLSCKLTRISLMEVGAVATVRLPFATGPFNELRTSDEATQYAKGSAELQEDLENWDNRARCFFHEITHLAYFVSKWISVRTAKDNTRSLFFLTDSGASGKTPNVNDLRITFGTKTKRRTEDIYGPYLAKILRNFRADGWYPGQNADIYTWFTMAMWARKEIGHYAGNPKSKGIKPVALPRRADGSSLNDPAGAADSSDDSEDIEEDYQPLEGSTPPDCGSRMSAVERPLPVLNVSCVDAASAIPADDFSSASN
jgi:hypothetical protein